MRAKVKCDDANESTINVNTEVCLEGHQVITSPTLFSFRSLRREDFQSWFDAIVQVTETCQSALYRVSQQETTPSPLTSSCVRESEEAWEDDESTFSNSMMALSDVKNPQPLLRSMLKKLSCKSPDESTLQDVRCASITFTDASVTFMPPTLRTQLVSRRPNIVFIGAAARFGTC